MDTDDPDPTTAARPDATIVQKPGDVAPTLAWPAHADEPAGHLAYLRFPDELSERFVLAVDQGEDPLLGTGERRTSGWSASGATAAWSR
ncbi:hypothetical protein [Kineosporia babensis]|uniref:Uncharacterized protein n=1 Tax=Kineosporia babensis TaxID=499548 RepID=A0A9X1N983_9ACTN|nr:hypothetical protein [Kineosporia babensis]MCD5309541.1 hypothetical protein [Kineosporia babensis]